MKDAEPMFLGARTGAGHSRLLDSDYDTFGSGGNFESANILSANLARRQLNQGRPVLSVKSDLSD